MQPEETARLDKITETVYRLLSGHVPAHIDVQNDPDDEIQQLSKYINRLIDELDSSKNSLVSISNGDIHSQVKGKLIFDEALKNLQATLNHLTWQTKQVAAGDFTQRVDFLGDFSEAFNRMVEQLDRDRRELLRKGKQLEEKNEELDSFAYIVSHDLKAPLVTIEGFAGLLLEDYSEVLDDQGRKYLDHIRVSVERLRSMINNVLHFARMGQTSGDKQDIRFNEIVRATVDQLKGSWGERGVEVVVMDSPAVIRGDKTRVMQIFQNLISNAVKYCGEENPAPRVEICVLNQDGENVFCVRDNGIGIPEKYQNNLFRMFKRVPNNEKTEGSGLGLAIAKRIIQSYGGRIWVESKEGRGSVFYFTFPGNDE